MSKSSFKRNLNARRLTLVPAAVSEKGEVLSYKVFSKDRRFKKYVRNGIKTAVAQEATAKEKPTKAKAKPTKQKAA